MAKKGGPSEKRHPLVEAIGWFGAAIVIIAYGLLVFNVLKADSAPYLIMNIIGSVCLVVIAEVKKLFQSVVLNVIWGTVALIALIGLWRG